MFAFVLFIAVASADYVITKKDKWEDGKFSVIVLDKCSNIEGSGSFEYVKVKDKEYKTNSYEKADCEGNPVPNEDGNDNLEDNGEEFVTKLPAHIAYFTAFSDNTCKTEEHGATVAFDAISSECLKVSETEYVKNGYLVSGEKKYVVKTRYSDNQCKQAITEPEEVPGENSGNANDDNTDGETDTDTTTESESESKQAPPASTKRTMKKAIEGYECDACAEGDDGYLITHCTQYNGSISMAILVVLMAIAFLF